MPLTLALLAFLAATVGGGLAWALAEPFGRWLYGRWGITTEARQRPAKRP